MRVLILAAVGLSMWACDPGDELEPPAASEQTEQAPAQAPEAEAEPEQPAAAGPIADEWVQARVADARERLEASEAGKLVRQAIEAHGGLATWLSKGTVEFEFDYQPLGQPERRMHTFQRVDLWRSRAHHKELGEGADAEFAFDGEQAWIEPGPEAFPTPARFWATTPYYFVGLPFVAADPGARWEQLEDAELEGERHQVVKLTYAPGTGDSPEDYYILYLHPETRRLAGLRYIVAYPGFFKPGQHSPEKLMIYSDYKQVDGLSFPHRLDTYAWNADKKQRGDKVTEVTVSRVDFGQRYPADIFEAPDEAVISPLKGS